MNLSTSLRSHDANPIANHGVASHKQAMSERKITVLDEPMTYVGIPKNADSVIAVLNPDTEHEVRVLMGALQAIATGQQMIRYGEQLLAGYSQVVERYERIAVESNCIKRERPAKLDA